MTEAGNLTQPGEEHHYFGTSPVDPAMVRFVVGLSLGLVLLLISALKPPLDVIPGYSYLDRWVRLIEVDDSISMLQHLRRLGLWELEERHELPPVIFRSFPPDIGEMRLEARKRLFLHGLAPTALVALDEVERERAELLRIIGRMDQRECPLDQLLDGAVSPRQCGLSRDEADFLEELSAKYRTEQLEVLLNRVNVVPLSLIMAQAALESSWGASRFSLEGNNIFGIWTWGEHGMVPSNRSHGMTHRVAVYDSLLDAVRSYLLMLNRVAAYRSLRDIRRQTMDPLALVNGLRYYSEKREEYVDDLRRFILANRLQRYDSLSLSLTASMTAGPLLSREDAAVLINLGP